MNNRIVEKDKLLDENGKLKHRGYATSLILDYERKAIKAPGFKIKEWDYYLLINDDFAVALTIADNSYMSLISASFLDFNEKTFKTSSVMKFLTFGKLKLPQSSTFGDTVFENKQVLMRFMNDGNKRHLVCRYKNFDGDNTLDVDCILSDEPKDSMVIATPFPENDLAFYYNQKINCMKVNGKVSYKGKTYNFEDYNTRAVLDWGRGVWTYKNTWYWGSCSTLLDGKEFGFRSYHLVISIS